MMNNNKNKVCSACGSNRIKIIKDGNRKYLRCLSCSSFQEIKEYPLPHIRRWVK